MARSRHWRVVAFLLGFGLLAGAVVWRVGFSRPVTPSLPTAGDAREARLRELLFDDPKVAAGVGSAELEGLARELLVMERSQQLRLASTKSAPLRLERPVDLLRDAVRKRLAEGLPLVALSAGGPEGAATGVGATGSAANGTAGVADGPPDSLGLSREEALDRAIEIAAPRQPATGSQPEAPRAPDAAPPAQP